jgi:hypothetical protein
MCPGLYHSIIRTIQKHLPQPAQKMLTLRRLLFLLQLRAKGSQPEKAAKLFMLQLQNQITGSFMGFSPLKDTHAFYPHSSVIFARMSRGTLTGRKPRERMKLW